MDRVEKAKELFLAGFNCSQAVFAAFADKYGIDEKTALKLAASFGGGIGRMREVCGAVSGMVMVCGMETGYTEAEDREGKAKNYEMTRKLTETFQEMNGSIICRELLSLRKEEKGGDPEERTKNYYLGRPCLKMVMDAAILLEKEFGSAENIEAEE